MDKFTIKGYETVLYTSMNDLYKKQILITQLISFADVTDCGNP